MVKNLNYTLPYEKYFLYYAFVWDDCIVLWVNSAKHADDALVCESTLTFIKEMIEVTFEFVEDTGVLNQLSLHLGCYLLEKVELLDNHVEVK